MESKRKANNHSADADDRSSKRRKIADIDLSKGETRESTTAYGLAFLEQIRRTQDKNGRLVATYFEQLLPRADNAEYYKKTRLPISLETIEEKLNKGEFKNLAEVESDFKRMILNAKDFYPRSTPIFDDAERVRKALSNYMTKTNPAYSTRGYQAVPTPLPPEVEEEEEEEEAEDESKQEVAEAEEGGEEAEVGEKDGDINEEMKDREGDEEEKEEGGEEVDGVAEEEGVEEKAETGNAEGEDPGGEEEKEEEVVGGEDGEKEEEEGDEDAEGEEEPEDPAAENDQDDSPQDEEMEVEAEEEEVVEEDEEEEDEPRSRRKSIILKRKGAGRTAKTVAPVTQPNPESEEVSYKGLTFQQAQEKIVEELLRHHEPEYDDPYFEAFINLPPRALRDYYKVISDPISLKKLQKLVKGIHGRGGGTVFTGTSELKSWSAFEEKAKLLWTNAYFYNEEGSDIYLLAQDLERQFYKHFNKAQAAVAEPAQPKIKLKIGQMAETPNSKKITIHVGGRGGFVESPMTQTAASTEPANDASVHAPVNPTAGSNGSNGVAMARTGSSNLDAARSVSQSAVSPSPSMHAQMSGVKEESVQASPAASATTPVPMAAPTMVRPPIPPVPSQPAQDSPLNGLLEQRRFRGPGKGLQDALISQLRIQSHPSPQTDRAMVLTVLPNAREMHQSATINLSPQQSRVFIVASLPQFLQDRQYSLWTLMDKQPLKQCLAPIPGQQLHERAFDVMLHPGLNIIETHLIAAIPRSEREPGGPEVELEVFTILVNVTRI